MYIYIISTTKRGVCARYFHEAVPWVRLELWIICTRHYTIIPSVPQHVTDEHHACRLMGFPPILPNLSTLDRLYIYTDFSQAALEILWIPPDPITYNRRCRRRGKKLTMRICALNLGQRGRGCGRTTSTLRGGFRHTMIRYGLVTR